QKVKVKLENQLKQQLARIGDDFKPRDYYLKKWGLELNTADKKNIKYNFLPGEEHVVQSPENKFK
ncbi:MAG TPA: hypothetical protein VFM79_04665, partial [Pelobium sp.]|nr:hypothetical protein [Pelobium sp.]